MIGHVTVALSPSRASTRAADEVREPGAEIDAERVHAERRRATLGREVVGDQRQCGRRERRLTDGDAEPREQQLIVACAPSHTAPSSTLHTAMPMPMIVRRLPRSASRPMGTPSSV